MEAARRWCPPGIELRFSFEPELLDTGGAIRAVADFLRESDPCLLLGGDMLLDVDLGALVERHRARRRRRDAALARRSARRELRLDRHRCAGLRAPDRHAASTSAARRGRASTPGSTWSRRAPWTSLPERTDLRAPRSLDRAAARRRRARRARRAGRARGLPLGAGRDAERVPRGESAAAAPLLPRRGRVASRAGTRFEPGLVLGAGATLGAGASLRARGRLGRRDRPARVASPGWRVRGRKLPPVRVTGRSAREPVPGRERPDERGGLRRHQRRLRGGRAAPVGAARARAARRRAAGLRHHHDHRARGPRDRARRDRRDPDLPLPRRSLRRNPGAAARRALRGRRGASRCASPGPRASSAASTSSRPRWATRSRSASGPSRSSSSSCRPNARPRSARCRSAASRPATSRTRTPTAWW